MDNMEKFIIGLLALMLIAIPFVFIMAVAEEKKFKQYVEDHNCEVIDSRSEIYTIMMPTGTSGSMRPMIQSEVVRTYKCDNNEIFER